MSINRILFFFRDGQNDLINIDNQFYPLCLLLNRLINEKYNGRKIKFLNLKFSTEKTYQIYPKSPKYYTHHYQDTIFYNDVFNLEVFSLMTKENKSYFLWERAYEILIEVSAKSKISELAIAAEYAYYKGLKMNLETNFRLLEEDIVLYGTQVKAILLIKFDDFNMYSVFTLEKGYDTVIFEQQIDSAKLGVDYFLTMYKKIVLINNTIVIKGLKDVDYLPLRFNIPPEIIQHGMQL